MPEARMQWEYVIKLRTSMYWSNFVLSIYLDAFKNKETTGMAILKKIKTSIAYIYTKNKKINGLETNKALFLKNKIEVKKLFLNHIYFYFKTSLALKKIKHG
jgi:hypothetical protein